MCAGKSKFRKIGDGNIIMERVRIGILGVGVMGSNHANNVSTLGNCKLSAICDIKESALECWKDSGAELYTDPEVFFKKAQVDAVIIATPHYSHVPLALEAVKRGWHVLVEKPVAVEKLDAERLVKAAETHPELVMSAMFCLRTIPMFIKVKHLIDSGELGKIIRFNWIITDWFRTQAYYDSGTWRATWRGEGGGVLLNQCPHQLDLMQWFFGMPSKITSQISFGKYHTIEVEDEVTAMLEYPDGKTAVFVASTGEAPGTNRLEIAGDQGKLVLENGKLTFIRNEIPVSKFRNETKLTFALPPVWTADIPFGPSPVSIHRVIIENFANAILNGDPLIAPAAEGIRGLEIGNAMLLSQLKGQSVTLPIDAAEYNTHLQKLIKNSSK